MPKELVNVVWNKYVHYINGKNGLNMKIQNIFQLEHAGVSGHPVFSVKQGKIRQKWIDNSTLVDI